ncbi:hypothetical protein PGT21_028568 [Puccinia graminis f. sp. tritici]|uniref:Uncharacterized protein n=1 Tax=Puccinia graminis f. sp. tritici TaxID=56615 RepID=A0A5B0PEM2_PUCGR|nr:hypothetical protein PGT21_028568 [Puccinia graminis f. sp. tritici]
MKQFNYFNFYFATSLLIGKHVEPSNSITLNDDLNLFEDLSELPEDHLRPPKPLKISEHHTNHLTRELNNNDFGSSGIFWNNISLEHCDDIIGSGLNPSSDSGGGSGLGERDTPQLNQKTEDMLKNAEEFYQEFQFDPQFQPHHCWLSSTLQGKWQCNTAFKDQPILGRGELDPHSQSYCSSGGKNVEHGKKDTPNKTEKVYQFHGGEGEELNQILDVIQQKQNDYNPEVLLPVKSKELPKGIISQNEEMSIERPKIRFRVMTGTQGANHIYFKNGERMLTLCGKAFNSLEFQSAEDSQAFKIFEDKLLHKTKDIEKLYAYNISPNTGEFKEIGGLLIFMRHLTDDCIQIRLPTNSKSGKEKNIEILTKKIKRIGEALNAIHNLYSLNELDKILHIKPEKNHKSILDWLYEILFIDTEEHLPLLGTRLESSLLPTKKFNTAQICLYKSLTHNEKSGKVKDMITALNLMEIWYQTELSRNGKALSTEEYRRLASLATELIPIQHRAKNPKRKKL